MSNTWEYAEHVKKVQQYGGPRAYVNAVRRQAFEDGYVTGKADGPRRGVLYMLPFVAGCCYLTYEKWPIIWNKIRIKMYLSTRNELTQRAKQEDLNLKLVCPICGKEATGIDEVIKLFGFDLPDGGELIPREVCRECWDKINNEE